jgi:hypothetical protein
VIWKSEELMGRTEHLRVVDENASWRRAEELARLIGRNGLLCLDHDSLGMGPGKWKCKEDGRRSEGEEREGEGGCREGGGGEGGGKGGGREGKRATMVGCLF